MRKLLYTGLAFLLPAFLLMPPRAQARSHSDAAAHGSSRHATVSRHVKSKERSNKGGRVRGRERAEEVHAINRRGGAHRGFTRTSHAQRAEAESSITQARRGRHNSRS